MALKRQASRSYVVDDRPAVYMHLRLRFPRNLGCFRTDLDKQGPKHGNDDLVTRSFDSAFPSCL